MRTGNWKRLLAAGLSMLLTGQSALAGGWSYATQEPTPRSFADRRWDRTSSKVVGRLLINEADVNQAGSPDFGEFVELINAGDTDLLLSDFNLRHLAYNWWSLLIDLTIDLPDVVLAPGETYVLCGYSAQVARCDSQSLFLLNDANGVLAVLHDPGDSGGGATVIDSFVYGPFYEWLIPAPPGGGSWIEGEPEDEFDGTNHVVAPAGFGFARVCHGFDADDNRTDFTVAAITPGAPNLLGDGPACPSCGCQQEAGQLLCCSGQGTCDRSTGVPSCVCDPGWGGALCDVPDLGCEPGSRLDCGDRGTCVELEPGATACECDSGYLGESCERSVRDLAIRKNAPPEDFDVLRLPAPEELGAFATCGLREIELVDTPDGCSWEGSLQVMGSSFELALFAGRTAAWSVELHDPNGRTVDVGPPSEGLADGIPGTLSGWQVDAATTGEWTLRVDAGGAPCTGVPVRQGGVALCQEESPIALFAHPRQRVARSADTIGFDAYVVEDAAAARDAFLNQEPAVIPIPAGGLIEEVVALVRFPDGTIEEVDTTTDPDAAVFSGLLDSDQTGDHVFALTVSGTADDGTPFQFDRLLSVTTVNEPLRFLRPEDGSVVKVSGSPILGAENAAESTIEFRLALDLPGLSLQEKLEAITHEYFFAAEVWGVAVDQKTDEEMAERVPVGWIGGLDVPTGGLGGDTNFAAWIDLELRAQWIVNANLLLRSVPGSFRVRRFELRNARIHEARTMLPVDEVAGPVPLPYPEPHLGGTESDEEAWVRQLAGTFVDWREDRSMIDGAPSEFTEALEEFLADNEVPALVGDLVLAHGHCDYWDAFFSSDFRNVAVGSMDDRPVHFVGSFTGIDGRKPRIVKTGQFRDELVDFLNPMTPDGTSKAHPRADDGVTRRYLPVGVVGHSQGGLAALLGYSTRQTSLQALHDFSDRFEVLQTVAVPYRGSGLDEALGVTGGVVTAAGLLSGLGLLGLFASLTVRAVTRFIASLARDCRGVRIVLDRAHVYAVMSCIPRADREVALQTRVKNGSRSCHWATNFFLAGDDDGVVQFERARVEGVRQRSGIGEPYCHSEFNGRFRYPDVRRSYPITNSLCMKSFVGFLDPGLCPPP